ncbi:MAG: hydrogenase maturation nickel metallochaperone HypA [Sterolibacterium sp.]
MHEMALAEGVLQLIEDAARRESFSRVKTVWLEIGQLSCVAPEALAFCFDAVTRGSIAEGSHLEIVATPGSGWCMQCAVSVPMAELYAACPQCGGYQLQVTSGTEMRLKELEVEE